MDRRKSIKTLIVTTVSTGALIEACTNEKEKAGKTATPESGSSAAGSGSATGAAASPDTGINRMPEEAEHDREIRSKTFFTPDEMATLTILADIIIPRDGVSGSASDAGVPGFIEFIVKDMPGFQTPMRGGLRWLDLQCLERYQKTFVHCTHAEQIEMVDQMAWPGKVRPGMEQGVAFFSLMRNLTASGFYTSEIGIKDIGYMGNVPNQWSGVPADVLQQYGLAYTERERRECAS